jgi:hypothetical protein
VTVGAGTRPTITGNSVTGYIFADMWGTGYTIADVPIVSHPLPASHFSSTVDILIKMYLCYIFFVNISTNIIDFG